MKKPLSLIISLLKITLGVIATLILTLLITAFIVLYVPPAFKATFKLLADQVSADQEIDIQLINRREFQTGFPDESLPVDDERLFQWLQQRFGGKQYDTFFSHSLLIKRPLECTYTLYGKHRTMNVYWVVRATDCEWVNKAQRHPTGTGDDQD